MPKHRIEWEPISSLHYLVHTYFHNRCAPNRPPPSDLGGRQLVESAPGSCPDAMLRKVLVVDDEADLADLVASLLEAHGLEVSVAYSAYEAIEVLKNDPDIDAIFSDIVMPGMTGLQLAEVVRTTYPRLKVVLASGYTQRALIPDSGLPYLFTTKPYQITTLLKLLRS